MDFAVQIDGEKQGRWVLAVEGDRLLVADEANQLRWVEMTSCRLLKAATPDVPRLVMPVQAQKPILVPQMKVGMGNGRH